jgi:hypothetical protein
LPQSVMRTKRLWNQRLWKGFRMTAQGCVSAPQGVIHRAKLVPASVMRTKRLWNQRRHPLSRVVTFPAE